MYKIFLLAKILDKSCSESGRNPYGIMRDMGCREISFESIQDIVHNCTELTEINLGYMNLCDDSFLCLAKNLTPKIKKINLCCTDIRDDHVNCRFFLKKYFSFDIKFQFSKVIEIR